MYKRDAYLSQAMIYYKDLIKKYYHREQTKIPQLMIESERKNNILETKQKKDLYWH